MQIKYLLLKVDPSFAVCLTPDSLPEFQLLVLQLKKLNILLHLSLTWEKSFQIIWSSKNSIKLLLVLEQTLQLLL